jgi:hypothetical protein
VLGTLGGEYGDEGGGELWEGGRFEERWLELTGPRPKKDLRENAEVGVERGLVGCWIDALADEVEEAGVDKATQSLPTATTFRPFSLVRWLRWASKT